MLPAEKYIDVIEHTALVSVDIIPVDEDGNVLVGKRKNEPAKGTWFVPGSRLFKHESIDDGITRVLMEELGLERTKEEFIGVFDHFYETNFLERADSNGKLISTHYVAICYAVGVLDRNKVNQKVALDQHSEIEWASIADLLSRDDVHDLTKNYLRMIN